MTATGFGTCTISARSCDPADPANTDPGYCTVTVSGTTYNVFESVDLGLSVRWASMNVGASAPEGRGDYFAWGDPEPYYEAGYSASPSGHWKTGKEAGYAQSDYKWRKNNSYKSLTKYYDQ